MDNLDSFLKLLQENRILAGYLIVGGLFLILLVFLLVKSFAAPKQPALASSPMPPAPKMSAMAQPSIAPRMMTSEQPDTRVFLDQLKKVADESQKVIYKLDTEIAEKERIISEKTEYVQRLEQQISEMPVEQILNQQSEKLKKESEKKLAQLKQEASTKSYQMWFFGFLVGLVITAGVVAAYYFLVMKAI